MVIIWAAIEYVKKGPLATTITTHHLVSISLYYFEVCFLFLTIGSKRKKFGLPIRNRDMAHDYKLKPVLGDNANYIDWCKELDA